MITYIDSANREKYLVLFDKASIKLGLKPEEKEVEVKDPETGEISTSIEYYRTNLETGAKTLVSEDDLTEDHLFKDAQPITSLNGYFNHLPELAHAALNTDPYFLRLPADEPYLEIDGNTRNINVSNEMRQIGVVGDNFAEIVFFRIGRYFDAVDLSTCDIYIEWQAPNGDRGAATAILKDTQSEKDKLIFGWAIGPELTKTTGNITFSVRFVKWMDDAAEDPTQIKTGTGLKYSLGTTRATMAIVDTLHYSLFGDEEALSIIDGDGQLSTIVGFLEVGESDGVDETTGTYSAVPVFLRNLEGELVQAETADMPAIYHANLPQGKDADNNTVFDNMEVMVEAYSTDGGRISYSFLRSENNDGSMGHASKVKYIESDKTSDSNRVLYKKEANDTYSMVPHSEVQSGEKYYEKVQVATINKPGYYSAFARNVSSGHKTSKKKSNILYIPYAAKPEVTTPVQESFVINKQEYTQTLDETISQTGIAAGSNIVFTVSEMGPGTVVLSPTITTSDSNAEGLTYQWYKGSNPEMTDAVAIEVDGNGATYEAQEPGYYGVKVTNFFNNDYTETDMLDAGVCRVTNMPEPLSIKNWENFRASLLLNSLGAQEIEIVKPEESDECSFEWHKITTDGKDDDVLKEWTADQEGDFASGVPTSGSTVGTEDSPAALQFQNGVAKIKFLPHKTGIYYLVLKNKLNGAEVPVNTGTSPSYGYIVVTND